MEYLKNVQFIKSVFNKSDLIRDDLPIIAMVGKSNVGKSSFINALTNNKNTAKVGQTPGKTKCLNFFLVNNEFYLVDLPGYGYSTMSEKEKENINKLTNYFLENNEKKFKALQIYEWLYDKKVNSFYEMTNISLNCAKCTDKLCTQYCKKRR